MRNSTNPKSHVIDPVCGMEVNPDQTNQITTHDGCKYYFCSEVCRKVFEGKPDDYLQNQQAKRKGWWGRYLTRLQKATGGKPMSCH